jgi:hypothetical protein
VSDSVSIVVYVLVGVAVVIAVVSVVIAARAARLARESRREYQRIVHADADVVDALLDRISAIDASTKTVEQLAELVQVTRDDLAHSLRHVAVVRYDAFRDVSGRSSFSIALLDDSGDGVIMTSLHGRSETQFIAKGITDANADSLSPEEAQAVEYALKGTDK